MNVLWTQLMPEVATHTPGAPQTLVLNQIRNSAIELCRRSRVWRIYADPMSITAGQPDYDFPDVFQTEVQDIIRMWFIPDGNPINPITFEKADALLPNWRLMSQYRPYNYVVDHENQQFTLIYTPSETIQDCIGLRVSLRPSMTSIGIDSVIFEEYFEVIAAGAKAKLLAMPKKPWTDAHYGLYGLHACVHFGLTLSLRPKPL